MCDGKEETIYLDKREFEWIKKILVEESAKIDREDCLLRVYDKGVNIG